MLRQVCTHTHTCAHSKTCTVTPPTLCFTVTQEGFTNPVTVGRKFLGAGGDGVLVSPRTAWEEVKLPLSRSSCITEIWMNAMTIHKAKYKGHRELLGVIHAKNDLPWASNTAHLFSKSLLSPYCTADPVLVMENKTGPALP